MSKVEELREKYPSLTQTTFNKFVEGDHTPTKKYLDYLLKTWNRRSLNQCPSTTQALINLVKQFDELLPYIVNKDIYIKEYNDVAYLKLIVSRAEEDKEENTFVRNENVFVLDETDEYILLQPLTHRGSFRYGAGTRWCTASKRDPQVFKRYVKSGLLVYLIDKKNEKNGHYKKVAFHCTYNQDAILGGITTYNSYDSQTNFDYVISNGWSKETIIKVSTMFRILFERERKLKNSRDFVTSFSESIEKLSFESLIQHLEILGQNGNFNYNSNVKEQINNFIKNLNNFTDARFTKTPS